jgi:RNA polymerase sigma-70 factor, ECF subfamily
MTPEQLAVRAQEGSLAAFSALVEQFDGRLFNFLLKKVGSAADAEDLAQDTFVRAWQRIAQYNPRWRFSTWLFTIGGRLAASKYRDRPAPPVSLTADRVQNRPPATDRLVRREERLRIWSIVEARVPAEQHAALWLRYAEDMSIGDVARVLGKSEVAVRVMLFRARGVLAEHLADPERDQQRTSTPERCGVPGTA